MASVFAIVSKAIFDAQFPATQCGNVLPIDRYVSKHPSFARMQKGDAIFLFTVRPKDVPCAIVEAPKKKGKAWVGKPSTTPVCDITGVLPLQTPRKLTDADVTLLRATR